MFYTQKGIKHLTPKRVNVWSASAWSRNHEGGNVTTDEKAPLFIVRPGSLLSWVLQNPVSNRHWHDKLREEYFYTPLDSSVL